jgi:GxxExxY protein
MGHQDTKPAPEPIPDETNRIARIVVDAAFAVHTQLGPDLLESVYELCLVHELKKRGLAVEEQMLVPVSCDGV